ncbi:MAG: hypothetical protein JNL58_24765 [Planctomyces sp.]|nr:hypothetical protein [Planctomyces sp.]
MRSGLIGFLLTIMLSLTPAAGQDESQRILPLPQGSSSDLRRQMELLRQFRAMMEPPEKQPTPRDQTTGKDTPSPESLAGQLREFEQLRDALQKLRDQLPRGIDPSQLDNAQKDQIQKAMQDPTIQQQVKRLLEQFSKDGVIPPTDGAGTEPPLPLPPSPAPPEDTTNQEQRSRSESKPNPSENRKKPLTRRDNSKPSETQRNGSSSKQSNPKSNPEDTSVSPPTESTAPSPGTLSPGSPVPLQQTPQDPISETPDREPSENRGTEKSSNARDSSEDSVPEQATPGNAPNTNTPSIRPETAQQLRKFWNDLSDRMTENSNSQENPAPSRSPAPSQSPGTRTPSARPSNQKPASEVLRDLEQNLPRNLAPIELPKSDPERSPGRQPMNQDSGTKPSESEPKSVDVQKELQRGGIGRVFEKIMEKAREEQKFEDQRQERIQQERMQQENEPLFNQQQSSPESPDTNRSSAPGFSSNGGNQDRTSAANMLRQGLENLKPGENTEQEFRKVLENVGSELRKMSENGVPTPDVNGPAGNSWTPNIDDTVRIPKPPNMESPFRNSNGGGAFRNDTLKGVGDTASQLMKSIVSPPTLPDVRSSAASGGGLTPPSLPSIPSTSFFWVLVVMFGLIALAGVAFVMARLGAPRLFDRLTSSTGHSEPLPQQLRSRRDIIRVFHAMALSPKNSAESWWTHRQVEKQLVQKSPQQSDAVRTLVEVYEQARYLPEELPLPPTQIAAAEQAMHAVGVPGK